MKIIVVVLAAMAIIGCGENDETQMLGSFDQYVAKNSEDGTFSTEQFMKIDTALTEDLETGELIEVLVPHPYALTRTKNEATKVVNNQVVAMFLLDRINDWGEPLEPWEMTVTFTQEDGDFKVASAIDEKNHSYVEKNGSWIRI